MPYRPRSCPVAPWQVDPSRSYLTVWEGSGVKTYTLAPELLGLRRMFNEIFSAADLSCKPHFFFVEDAYGAGGFAYGNLLVIGRKDQEQIISTTWNQNMVSLTPFQEAMARRSGQRVYTVNELRDAAYRFVISHELGHARQFENHLQLTPTEAELDADRFAGILGEHFGFDYTLAQMLARAIGCTGMSCVHGTPAQRANAYSLGVLQMRQASSQSRAWLQKHSLFEKRVLSEVSSLTRPGCTAQPSAPVRGAPRGADAGRRASGPGTRQRRSGQALRHRHR